MSNATKMKKCKLGELLAVKHGWAFKGEFFEETGEQCILTPGNFYEQGGFKINSGKERYYSGNYPEEYLCKKGDLIVAMTQQAEGLLGSTAIVPEDNKYLHNQRIGLITCDETKLNSLFAYYLFMTKTVREQLERSSSGTKVKHTSPERIYDVIVKIPDICNQFKIVSLLYNIEKKINTNNKINDNLEQQAKLLYDYWFTQFDFPDENGKPYRSSGGKMVWNDTLKRNIPDGWQVESIISNSLSSVIKPGVEAFDTKLYLATADVRGTSLSTGSLIDYEGRESRANMQPIINSVWFAKMKNSIKHLYLNKEMHPIISNSILSTGFCGLLCSEKSFEYIASYITNPYFEVHKDMLAHGATQEAVNNDDLKGVHIIIPYDSILQVYHETTQPIYAQISENICENQELVKLRDWLLPMLMNGQATISD